MRTKVSPLLRALLTRCHLSRHVHSGPTVQVVSGIQPTGNIHIGNYFGAIRQWVDLQDGVPDLLKTSTYLPPVFQIVDMHSITMSQEPDRLRENIFELTAVLLGCGIDPAKCILFKQSSVPLNSLLFWVLACVSTTPQLARFPQFKEKSAAFKSPPLGLYLYPVLQAADILLYKGTHVPIGDDQIAHIELAKDIVEKFHHVYKCDIFPIPSSILSKSAGRVKSLRAPEKKMSKSEADTKSRIDLTDPSDEIIRKIRKSVTDFTSEVTYNPKERPRVSNLVEIYSNISGLSTRQVCDRFTGKNTLQFKTELGDLLAEYMRPIRARIVDLSNDRHYLESVLLDGAARALTIAEETICEMQSAIGSDMANLFRAKQNSPLYMKSRPTIH